MINEPTEFQSLDDLLNATYTKILDVGNTIKSKREENLEITNFNATLVNPRVRTSLSLDRKLVKSKFAEFAWYLSKEKSLTYITPYIAAYNKEEQENEKILGAYGPKIFGNINGKYSQFERVLEQLRKRQATKQAYIAISDCEDYRYRDKKYSSPPCTIGLHFYARDSKLNLTTYMRSNDAYFGLPHDLFCFTMLQELVACRIDLDLGYYTHQSTSMHIYKKHYAHARDYLSEGFHEPIEMPKMRGCSNEVLDLVSKEFDVNNNTTNINKLDNYWKDYVLFSHRHSDTTNDTKEWLDQFSNEKMKSIATNSVGI